MKRLLGVDFPDYINIQAYADDIALTIAAPNRHSLVTRAAEALAYVYSWGTSRGLTFSPTKSIAVPIGCNLVPGFTIPFGTNRIRSENHSRYLGIILDQSLNYDKHIAFLASKNMDLFSRLRGAMITGGALTKLILLSLCTPDLILGKLLV